MNADQKRVLLAEDDEVLRLVMTKHLNNLAVDYECAEDGAKAVELALAKKYKLILMDIQMPVMDGLSAAKRIREDEKANDSARIPIVVMTAFANDNFKDNGNIDSFLIKPVSLQSLSLVLSKWIG